MAKYLTTRGVSYHLEELINDTQDQLILISPYLQFNTQIKQRLENLALHKKDIRIVYREAKLPVAETKWLENQIGIRTSVLPTLHAKCYLNEREAIVTSMNLYTYSQENNDEMGILVSKAEDPKLYSAISADAKRLLQTAEEIRVVVKTVDKAIERESDEKISAIQKSLDKTTTKRLTTKELSNLTGLSSRKVNSWLSDNKLMYKKGDDWVTTKKGKDLGGVEKSGQYGRFVIWPEEIARHIS